MTFMIKTCPETCPDKICPQDCLDLSWMSAKDQVRPVLILSLTCPAEPHVAPVLSHSL